MRFPTFGSSLSALQVPLDLPDLWQQEAVGHLKDGCDVVIDAPTGAGKTIVGEFAIHLAIEQQQKVFYTTPIKALSNQKYYDFKRKFPDISFGLITGDIKIGPNADF